jgi:hypothetical protein
VYTNKNVIKTTYASVIHQETTKDPESTGVDEESLEFTLDFNGIANVNSNPLDYLSNKNLRLTKSFDYADDWRIYLAFNPDRRTKGRASPDGVIVGNSYSTAQNVETALNSLLDEHQDKSNVGVIIEKVSENKVYTGYLNPKQNPTSYASSFKQISPKPREKEAELELLVA